ncbi:MAG: hypothetical protein CVV27_07765 [Candidatus Melainabacteria bacterium HGW-Melainabacteria-1]|nr:MAG: hypothetical protein CVV27_07765 [Candidatus Melainabacteria bacterium HGW-Melainabacteria-1]
MPAEPGTRKASLAQQAQPRGLPRSGPSSGAPTQSRAEPKPDPGLKSQSEHPGYNHNSHRSESGREDIADISGTDETAPGRNGHNNCTGCPAESYTLSTDENPKFVFACQLIYFFVLPLDIITLIWAESKKT